MSTFRSYPKHLGKPRGKGIVTCRRSGFLRHPADIVEDAYGRILARDKADFYDGFGTRHPQDVAQPETGGDPTPVPMGGLVDPTSKQDLKISDAEIRDAIRENRPPRPGF